MRWLTRSILILALIGLAISGAAADERPGDEGKGGGSAPDALASGMEALRLRIDARVKEGELLTQAGRLEEALEVYRSVGPLYEKGMADLEALLERVGAEPRPSRRRPVAAVPLPGGQPSQDALGEAVIQGLRWLTAHQSPDGGWSAAQFHRWCNGKAQEAGDAVTDKGKDGYDVGVTGLALSAFLSAGYTNRGKHPFAETIGKGLRYLKNAQDPSGCFGPRVSQHFLYGHAAASQAMIAAYALTGSPLFKDSAKKAVDFILQARNPYMGWRYGVRPGDNDTSSTAWMTSCLWAAKRVDEAASAAGRAKTFEVDNAAFLGALAWIDKMTDPELGRVGYMHRGSAPARPMSKIAAFPAEKSEALTAAGIVTRLACGETAFGNEMIQKGVRLMLGLLPQWRDDGSIDMAYWHWGTLAAYHVGGDPWKHWSAALARAALPAQRRDGDFCGVRGSWDPAGPWGEDGGRVYSTAMMLISLNTLMRSPRGD